MIKKIVIAVTLFLACAHHTLAYDFTKSMANPLPLTTSFTDWNQTGVFQPSIIRMNNTYALWYASSSNDGFRIARAESADGLTWEATKLYGFNPGISNHNPFILKTQDGYDLYFTSDGGGVNTIIKRIHSNDGITFDEQSLSNSLMPQGSAEQNGVFAPHVVSDSNSLTMFYTAWGVDGFRIHMATSQDGAMWNRCNENPILPFTADGSFLYRRNGIDYLFFHSEQGIEYVKTSSPARCESVWEERRTVLKRGPEPYDADHMISPTVIDDSDTLRLYYSGLGTQGWTLNMASSPNEPLVSVTPTPSVGVRQPIVFIPGLFASWNHDALIHDAHVPYSAWTLNPIVREYDGFIQTLRGLGYTPGSDLYIFAYDWRKRLDSITYDLESFLHTTVIPSHPGEHITIVGHSMGGLVGRLYVQRTGSTAVNSLVTVSSPHLGSAAVYKAVEAGEIETTNSVEWLIVKGLLRMIGDTMETDKELIARRFPIMKDLLPTSDFLKTSTGAWVPRAQMTFRNDYMNSYNTLLTDTSYLSAIGGVGMNTISGYRTVTNTLLDRLLGLYPDGRPISPLFTDGDGVVASASSLIGSQRTSYRADHGSVIYEASSISHILDSLHIPHHAEDIHQGHATNISPSILFMIQSPIHISISIAGQTYTDEDGILLLPNPPSGTHSLEIRATGTGRYRVLIGQTNGGSDRWDSIDGTVTRIGQTQTVPITISSDRVLRYPVDRDNPSRLLNELNALLESEAIPSHIKKTISRVTTQIATQGRRHEYNDAKRQILVLNDILFDLMRHPEDATLPTIQEALDKVTNYYELLPVSYSAHDKRILQDKITRMGEDISDPHIHTRLNQHEVRMLNQARVMYENARDVREVLPMRAEILRIQADRYMQIINHR